MDSDDGGPFSLPQSLTEGAGGGGGYSGNGTSVASQYHVWAAAAAAASSTSLSNNNNNTATTLPTHFSPVSPTGHGLYNDHLTPLHPTQSAVDALSMRLSQGDYHSAATDRLGQGDGYHTTSGNDGSGRHPGNNQSDYHDHLVAQERHLGLEPYHHISVSSSSSSSSSLSAAVSQQQQDRLTSSDYHTNHGNQSGERLAQNDYQSSRLSRNDYHTAQTSDRLAQNDYHSAQQSDRLVGQNDYHAGQQTDRLGQSDYHVTSQSDRLGQLDYSSGQSERLAGGLTKQDYHALGGDQLGGQHAGSYHSGQGGQQTGAFHSAQTADRSLAAQADYHSTQVDLDAVSMHADFDRRHLDVSLLPKDLVDTGQRGSALDYLTSQSARDTLAGLHPDIVGLQREIDLSVGQTISLPQRSAPIAADLASTSYGLDPATLPRDLSPYSPRDLDRAMLSASDVVGGQVGDGTSSHGGTAGVGLHPQDLAGINLTATSRDLVDMTTLARSGAGRDDLGRVRDVIHRPRANEIQRALELEVLGSLDNGTASVDLTLNGGNSTKSSSSRPYPPSTSRLPPSSSTTKRPTSVASQAADVRLQNSLSAVSVNSGVGAGLNFFPLATSRDPLNIMAMADPSNTGGSSRGHNSAADFTRQQPSDMSRLRRELTAPYPDLGVHHSMLATAASLPMPTFKSSVDAVFSAHGDLICNDSLASSRERLYEMMKQQQFCDAVLGTSLHSIKVHKAVLCSASAYLCGVLSQTCMGKSGGRILTVQFKADIPASSLSAFIDYMYQGRIKLLPNTLRDTNVMARCLHMESLKKTSEDMLVSMGASNDADVTIPELILLETLVDKLDKECTASFPLPTPPPPPPSCHVAVGTDPPPSPSSSSSFPSTHQSCQTEDLPECVCSSSSSAAMDLRSSCLPAVGGVGVNGVEDSLKTGVSEVTHGVCDPLGSSSFSTVKPHHKKHLASQASRVKCESAAVSTTVPFISSASLSSSSSSSSSSPVITCIMSSTDPTQSVDTSVHVQSGSLRSATPNPQLSKLPGKARKRTSLSPSLPSSSTVVHSVLPGQTARPVLHSYGTRAATRTPTKNLELSSSLLAPNTSTETQDAKDASGCGSGSSEAQIQMAKHRGRTKKGRIAAALSAALTSSSQAGEEAAVANLSEQKPRNPGAEDVKTALPHGGQKATEAKTECDSVQVPLSSPSDIPPTSTVTLATATTNTTTALTEAKHSAPRAYRKRLIQSVVTDLLMAKAENGEQDSGVKDLAESSVSGSEEMKQQTLADSGGPPLPQGKGVEKDASTATTEQLREMLHSPVTTKRKKKGKTRRMLLSSPSSTGGVRVRAPPKKRAKMELELEQLMREEMEEEEEEEEVAAAAAMAALTREPGDSGASPQSHSQQPASGSVVRIKMPSTKPGKKPRWIKKDRMAHLLIELNQKASRVALPEGADCVFVCVLCSNRFLLPKRCLSHVMATHKVPEAEVLDHIEVRCQQQDRGQGEMCGGDVDGGGGGGGGVSDDLVCDICGYQSRENTTYYLHYHKYFKHGVALPKGWSVYTCDLCGKELFTKFQLKDHKRTHLEKTPFVCEICGSGFQSRSNLHSHVFHRHREEKKHSCDKCDRTFKTRTQLSVHGRTHSGVRPFSCPLCHYRSTTRGNMRLHLINRHKLPNTDAGDIMRDMKPDFDVSLRSVSLQASCEENGTEKKPAVASKRKPRSNATKPKTKKEKEDKKKAQQETYTTTPKLLTPNNQSGLTIIELLMKNSIGDSPPSDKDLMGKESMDHQDLSMLGSSVVLAGEGGESSVVTLQAADPFPVAGGGGGGVGMCGEAGTVFLPPGLESMFQQPGSDLSLTTGGVPTNAGATTTTTFLVPENFLLQHQPQALQPTPAPHKHLYHPQQPPHAPPQFTSFVVGPPAPAPAPHTLQTLTPGNLIVSATALNPEGRGEVVDLADMSMVEVDGSHFRQSGLNPIDLNLQPSRNNPSSPTTAVAGSQEGGGVQFYMQHSPISPAPPLSPTTTPTPMYVAVTPTPSQPLAVVKQEGQDMATPAVAVSGAGVGGVGVMDQLQQQGAAATAVMQQQYDTSILQAYYAGQLYSSQHNC